MSEQPDESAALADRLGLCAAEPDDDVRLGDVPLTLLRRAEVRRRIVVSDTAAMLFSGRLADRLDVTGTGGVDRALDTASAADILEALPDGLETLVAERGRTLLRRPAAAARARARPHRRPRDPGAGRADLGRRRPHRGADRRAPAPAPRGPDHGRHDQQPAHARRRRRGRVPARRPGRRHRASTATCWPTTRSTAGSSPARPSPEWTVTPTMQRRRHRACRWPTRRAVRRYAVAIARKHPRLLWSAVALHVLAALAALAAPRLLGDLVQAVEAGTTVGHVDRIMLLLAGFLVVQTVLTRYARYLSQVLGEQVLAELREDFVGNALALPVGVVESAGSGDLLTRTSRDVDQLGWSVRMALPEWVIAVVTAILTFAAAHQRRLVGGAALPARRTPAGDRAAVVPRPRQGRLPARERVVLRDQRDAHRDRRGRPHRRGARPRRGADRRGRRRHRESYARGALHAVPAHGVLPQHGDRPT